MCQINECILIALDVFEALTVSRSWRLSRLPFGWSSPLSPTILSLTVW